MRVGRDCWDIRTRATLLQDQNVPRHSSSGSHSLLPLMCFSEGWPTQSDYFSASKCKIKTYDRQPLGSAQISVFWWCVCFGVTTNLVKSGVENQSEWFDLKLVDKNSGKVISVRTNCYIRSVIERFKLFENYFFHHKLFTKCCIIAIWTASWHVWNY